MEVSAGSPASDGTRADFGSFTFHGADEFVEASGPLVDIPASPETRVAGALPFDLEGGRAFLIAPEGIDRVSVSGGLRSVALDRSDRPAARAGRYRVVATPDRDAYLRSVRALLDALGAHAGQESGLRKVVLSRRLTVKSEGDRAIDVDSVFLGLRGDPGATAIAVRTHDSSTPRALVCATPETLIRKRGSTVTSHPLAGSAPRGSDPAADRLQGDGLLASAKDLEEHRIVVEQVLDTLAPWCSELTSSGPELARTSSVWHLGTRIEGTLRDVETPSIVLARALHPTPAVCGHPRAAARRLISGLEPFERGLYAGCVGWSDGVGDGTWMVTLRCAEIAGAVARLHAGAGIVPGSDPASEWSETQIKFEALLRALDVVDRIDEGAA